MQWHIKNFALTQNRENRHNRYNVDIFAAKTE